MAPPTKLVMHRENGTGVKRERHWSHLPKPGTTFHASDRVGCRGVPKQNQQRSVQPSPWDPTIPIPVPSTQTVKNVGRGFPCSLSYNDLTRNSSSTTCDWPSTVPRPARDTTPPSDKSASQTVCSNATTEIHGEVLCGPYYLRN